MPCEFHGLYDGVMRWGMMVLIVAGCRDDDPAPPAPADLAVSADDLAVAGGCVRASAACPPCAPPGANQVCVTGSLYDVASGCPVLSGGTSVRIAAYEPLSLLADPHTAAWAEDGSTNKASTR